MQPDLTRLTRELKKETCPQRVRDKVRGQISARESSPRSRRFAIPALAVALILVCCLSLWRWQAREKALQQAQMAQITLERARVATQAEDALGLVGSVLLDAGAHSGKVISDRAVPPLRNSLETAKNKIMQRIEL